MGEGSAKDEPAGGQAPPGWYPDPRGSGNLLYWDGSAWTGDVHSPAPQAAPKRSGQTGTPEKLIGGGGIALAISPFLTWIKVVLFGSLSLFQLYEAAGESEFLPWATVIAGLGAAAAAFIHRKRKTTFAIGLSVGLIGGALALYALINLRGDISDAEGFAALGFGPYVAVAGCAAILIGALMLRPGTGAQTQ